VKAIFSSDRNCLSSSHCSSVIMGPRFREDDNWTCVIGRIVWSAPGAPSSSLIAAPKGARNAGPRAALALPDPRTSMPRDTEACRSRQPQVRRSQASRARCVRLAPRNPGGQTIFTHRCWTDRKVEASFRGAMRSRSSGSSVRPSGHLPGSRASRGLDRRAWVCVVAPLRGHRTRSRL